MANLQSELENSAGSAKAPDSVSHRGGHAELSVRDSRPYDTLSHDPRQKEPKLPEPEERPDSSHEVVIEKPDKATL